MSSPSEAASPDAELPDRPASERASEAEGSVPASAHLVVGIGASAGGLEAITDVLGKLTATANLAIVVVQHLDPHHESSLVDLLNQTSRLPVQWAAHGQSLEPRRIYVARPHACLAVQHGVLLDRQPDPARRTGGIDHFFQSLATEYKQGAVGVLLSGNGSDGTAGAKLLKDMGGLVFAQDPSTAAFPSMPRAAIEALHVHYIMAPSRIGDELMKLGRDGKGLPGRNEEGEPLDGGEAEHLATIFRMLAQRSGVDFNDYKETTIKRRLARQMMLTKATSLADYVKLLQKKRIELDRLYESLLINVTQFFRDPEYFEFLATGVLPDIVAHHSETTPIRMWVPGAATGEEVYSLAIVMREVMEARGRSIPVQIFGTDVSDAAITAARAGLYSDTQVAKISPARLQRYFIQRESAYQIQKTIRDMCIFARQNVIKDSPFSRLDLISCRNLLIYLSQSLQRKLMPIFHYALNPGGYLVLGSSESVAGYAELFRLLDRRYRIYSRKSALRRARLEFSIDASPAGVLPPLPISSPPMPHDQKEPFDIIREADRIVLSRHGPTGVLVNEELEILQFRGDVTPYLAPVAGRASLNLLKMAREGLAAELQTITQESRQKGLRIRHTGLAVDVDGMRRLVDVEVSPLESILTKERFFLVLFFPAEPPPRATGESPAAISHTPDAMLIEQMRQELQTTRSYLQTTIEKHEVTNQELRAANEEIQSSNEELQSTNEELETAKEELQSTNEELTTVNEELHSRQLELIQVNNDLHNLINSVHLPIIILGQDMRIRRFTPMAERVLNVIPSDIGRPLSDINTKLSVTNWGELVSEVVDTLTIKELEVQDKQGRWYSMRVRPYKTAENRIEGVVIALIDIDQMKRTISQLEEARDFARAVMQTVSDPIAALDHGLQIEVANDAFARMFHTTGEAVTGRAIFELAHEHAGATELRAALEGILPTGGTLTDRELSLDLPGTSATRVMINARQIVSGARAYPLILLSLRRCE